MQKPLFAVAALTVLLTGCAETALPIEKVGPFKDDPRVSIVTPTEGETLSGGSVAVKLATSGKFKLVPAAEAKSPHVYGEGHYHLFLDVTPTPGGETIPKGVTGIYHVGTNDFVITGVSTGKHTLYVELGFSDHLPYQQTLTKVDFTMANGSTTGPVVTPTTAPSPSAAPSAAPSVSASAGPVAAKVSLDPDPNVGGVFRPSSVAIKVGQAVEWDWADTSAQHSTTSDDGLWDSGLEGAGFKFTQTFTTAGTFSYHCSVHPQMTGKVTVS